MKPTVKPIKSVRMWGVVDTRTLRILDVGRTRIDAEGRMRIVGERLIRVLVIPETRK